MNWTKEKPNKAGYYWYSKCFIKDSKFKYDNIGIIYVDKLNNFLTEEALNDVEDRDILAAMNGGSDNIVLINALTGMFSNKPIELPENMDNKRENNDRLF